MLLEESNTGAQAQQSPFFKYIRPIFVLTNVAGCYCYPLWNNFAYRAILRIYSTLVSVLLLYSTIRYAIELFRGKLQWNTVTVFQFFFFDYLALCFVSHLFISFAGNVIIKILQETDYDNQHSVRNQLSLKKIAIVVFLSVIFKIVVIYVTAVLGAFDVVHIAYFPDIFPGGPQYLQLFPAFFGQAALCIAMGLFAMLCAILNSNLKSISTEMGHSSVAMIQNFQKFQEHHLTLVRATRTLDGYFSNYIFLFYALSLPLICVFLFALIRSSEMFDLVSKLVIIFWVVITSIDLLLVSAPAILLYEEGQRSLDALFKLYNQEMSRINLFQIQQFHVFIEQITHSNISISGAGFFIVTRPMLLTIVSVLVTYFIIILQFATGEKENTCSSSCYEYNMTTVEP